MAKIPTPPRSRKGSPPPPAKTIGNLDKAAPEKRKTLNLWVSVAFHQELKIFAARHNTTMVDLIQEGFKLTKAKYEQ